MRRYLGAELRRVALRRPRMILWGALYLASAVIVIWAGRDGTSGEEAAALLGYILYGFGPLVLGLIELIYCCGEDVQSKIAQAAIGQGVSRGRLVLGKWLQTGAVLLCGLAGLVLVLLLSAGLGGISLTSSMATSIVLAALCALLRAQTCLALTLLVLYPTQNVLPALLLYLFLSSGVGGYAVELLAAAAGSSGVERWLPTRLLSAFASQLELGICNMTALAGIAAYTVLALGAAAALFRKKELEF